MRELLADPDVAGLEYDGVFGRTTVGASIVTFYGFDLVVHRWDIAVAAGLDEHLSDEELELLDRSADGFGDHLYDDGVCKPARACPERRRPSGARARPARSTDAGERLSGHRAQRYSTSGRPAPAYLDRRTTTLVSQRYSAYRRAVTRLTPSSSPSSDAERSAVRLAEQP